MQWIKKTLFGTAAVLWFVVVPVVLVALMVVAWRGMGDFRDADAIRDGGTALVLLAGLSTGVAYFAGWSLWRASGMLRGRG